MEDELKALQRDLDRIGRGRGARYPKELKQRVVAWSTREHTAGKSWNAIAEVLGIGVEAVRRWIVDGSKAPAKPRALVPVRVIEQVVPSEMSSSSTVTVSGWRVDGMTATEAAAFIRALK